MPAESKHHVSGPLTVAIGLAVTAGFVDAFIYRNITPVFVANMSGNMIRIGMATGTLDGHAIAASAIALATFTAAAIVGAMVIDRHVGRGVSPDPSPLLLAEVFLLAVVAAIAVIGKVKYSTSLPGRNIAVVIVGSAAMGLQAIALRRVGETAVSTTYGTGAVVRLGEKVALGLRRAPRHHGVPRRKSVFVLTTVLLSYAGGAALATAAPVEHGLLTLVPIATLVLAQMAHTMTREERRRPVAAWHGRRVLRIPRRRSGDEVASGR